MGLGNPGHRFGRTRHNAGFWLVDRWAERRALRFRKAWFQPFFFAESEESGHKLVLVKPLTFVNRSGSVVASLRKRFAPDELWVVFDQMDLSPGRVRAKPHGSSAGHNGLKSVDDAFGGGGYPRIAIGVGRPREASQVVDHVLGEAPAEDKERIDTAVSSLVERLNQSWIRGREALIDAANRPVTADSRPYQDLSS